MWWVAKRRLGGMSDRGFRMFERVIDIESFGRAVKLQAGGFVERGRESARARRSVAAGGRGRARREAGCGRPASGTSLRATWRSLWFLASPTRPPRSGTSCSMPRRHPPKERASPRWSRDLLLRYPAFQFPRPNRLAASARSTTVLSGFHAHPTFVLSVAK